MIRGMNKNSVYKLLFVLALGGADILFVSWILQTDISWITVSILLLSKLISSFCIFGNRGLAWSCLSQKSSMYKGIAAIVNLTTTCLILGFVLGVGIRFVIMDWVIFHFFRISCNYSLHYWNQYHSKDSKSVVIYGAGSAGIALRKEFVQHGYNLKFFIDDNKKSPKHMIHGTRVLTMDEAIVELKNEFADELVFAMPSADQDLIDERHKKLFSYFKDVKILPSIGNLETQSLYLNQLKDVKVEDLLQRKPKDLDLDSISNFIQDKVILVTGAGGSIGSELVRQCVSFKAKKIVLLDHNEFSLYQAMEELNTDIDCIPVMQSVVNFQTLSNVFAEHLPDIVLHAAAYKHVPMVEYNIGAGVLNNIIGTKNCIDLAIQFNIEKFVLVSTDKAVRPTNVMGATKRICELYAQNVDSKNTDIVAVRFGNVLGSSGSVIPKFKSLIEEGKNLTVTHPDITRYFMLIPEACQLVLQAGAIASGGEIFILDMGEPIRIADLAQRMLDMYGRFDLKVEFTSLRPGEKLYEELLLDDADQETKFESILIAEPTKYEIVKLSFDIEELLWSDEKLSKLHEIVPEFKHNNYLKKEVLAC